MHDFGNYAWTICHRLIIVQKLLAGTTGMRQIYWIVGLVVAAGAFVPVFGKSQPQVAYPDGYIGWERVKSMVIQEGHEHFQAFGGFHHVYANERAVAALKEREPFPKGAVLVFELFEALTDRHAVSEGQRLVIGVMEKDAERFVDTEGWGFEDFKEADPQQPSVTDMRAQCLSCHSTQKANDYVYTMYRQ